MEDVGAADHRGHQRPEDHRAERDVDEKIAGARTGLHAAEERPEAEDVDHGRGEQPQDAEARSEEHTSELQSLMRTSSAVFCLKKKTKRDTNTRHRKRTKTYTIIRL